VNGEETDGILSRISIASRQRTGFCVTEALPNANHTQRSHQCLRTGSSFGRVILQTMLGPASIARCTSDRHCPLTSTVSSQKQPGSSSLKLEYRSSVRKRRPSSAVYGGRKGHNVASRQYKCPLRQPETLQPGRSHAVPGRWKRPVLTARAELSKQLY
jgi:hypothetical protein